ncbi:MAG: hypothetical protein GY856_32195 [bacterium]|nr:hypothetical protein [bacterium]
MQAFRAATTVDQYGELHLSGVPFRPGPPVEVVVLEQVGQVHAVAHPGTSAGSKLRGSADPPFDGPSSANGPQATPSQRLRPTAASEKPPPDGPIIDPMQLAEEQYRLAGQYPNEYVVLIGERIVHHSPDRRQAAEAYNRAALGSSSMRPAIVRPGSGPRKPPVVRGRALTRKLGGMK